jgi:hypothetical protein
VTQISGNPSAGMKHLTVDKTDLEDYPAWSKTIDDINHGPAINHGVWAYYKGPPFLQRVTLYSGNDVDITKGGQLVRRLLGLPVNFGKWEGNNYVSNFESQQMHFLQSNEHSVIVIPPLSQANLPLLSDHAKEMIHRYVSVGHNSLIVTGGTGAVDFINKNLFADGISNNSACTFKLVVHDFAPFHLSPSPSPPHPPPRPHPLLRSRSTFSSSASLTPNPVRGNDARAGVDAGPVREAGRGRRHALPAAPRHPPRHVRPRPRRPQGPPVHACTHPDA